MSAEMSRRAAPPDAPVGVTAGTSPALAGVAAPDGPGPTALLDPQSEAWQVRGGSLPRLRPPVEAEVAVSATTAPLTQGVCASASAPSRWWLIDDVRWLTRRSTTITVKDSLL